MNMTTRKQHERNDLICERAALTLLLVRNKHDLQELSAKIKEIDRKMKQMEEKENGKY